MPQRKFELSHTARTDEKAEVLFVSQRILIFDAFCVSLLRFLYEKAERISVYIVGGELVYRRACASFEL